MPQEDQCKEARSELVRLLTERQQRLQEQQRELAESLRSSASDRAWWTDPTYARLEDEIIDLWNQIGAAWDIPCLDVWDRLEKEGQKAFDGSDWRDPLRGLQGLAAKMGGRFGRMFEGPGSALQNAADFAGSFQQHAEPPPPPPPTQHHPSHRQEYTWTDYQTGPWEMHIIEYLRDKIIRILLDQNPSETSDEFREYLNWTYNASAEDILQLAQQYGLDPHRVTSEDQMKYRMTQLVAIDESLTSERKTETIKRINAATEPELTNVAEAMGILHSRHQ